MASLQIIVPPAAGVLCFPCYFIRGEHHMQIVRYLQIFICKTVSQAAALYLFGPYFSRASYRLSFHPLNRFPGPIGARLTSFWFSWRLRNSDCFCQLLELHEQHGPIVRIGPNNLSIADPKAVNTVYSFDSRYTIAPWYDLTQPMVSLQTLRNKKLHDQRRRVWSAAFGDKMLRGYEQRLRRYRQKLMAHIDESNGSPINVTTWFNLYSFDFMGDMAFGQSFDMMEKGEHWAIKPPQRSPRSSRFRISDLVFPSSDSCPGLTRNWWRFINFCAERMEQRLKTKVEIPDISSALSTGLQDSQPTTEDMNLLRGDAQLIVVAGSDTTATTLTAAMWELAQHPDQIEKLREELQSFDFEPNGEILNEKIANLPHMNAVISETLRLRPPVPSMLQRKTPPEGIDYVIGRSMTAYHDPNAFIPERWTTQPELVKEKRAFAPFSAGPFGYIGRPLALLNVRTTLARLVLQYDIVFATGEDGSSLERKAKE
ncbi:putative cytochrome P450 [Stachybotrys elegans]|uniref:Cytochrome P450 n=1 Tax=Stachybotrys elegans TaxID=80388 RepID=A0A8K0SCD0_9HYPO|nr:putative cytochrome P450 [Stachybotrys elegans]